MVSIEQVEDAGLDGEVVVRVSCRSLTVVRGMRAVVTLPIGVLKAGGVAFSPPLPRAKADAVARVGVGCLNKVMAY